MRTQGVWCPEIRIPYRLPSVSRWSCTEKETKQKVYGATTGRREKKTQNHGLWQFGCSRLLLRLTAIFISVCVCAISAMVQRNKTSFVLNRSSIGRTGNLYLNVDIDQSQWLSITLSMPLLCQHQFVLSYNTRRHTQRYPYTSTTHSRWALALLFLCIIVYIKCALSTSNMKFRAPSDGHLGQRLYSDFV